MACENGDALSYGRGKTNASPILIGNDSDLFSNYLFGAFRTVDFIVLQGLALSAQH